MTSGKHLPVRRDHLHHDACEAECQRGEQQGYEFDRAWKKCGQGARGTVDREVAAALDNLGQVYASLGKGIRGTPPVTWAVHPAATRRLTTSAAYDRLEAGPDIGRGKACCQSMRAHHSVLDGTLRLDRRAPAVRSVFIADRYFALQKAMCRGASPRGFADRKRPCFDGQDV